MNKNTNLCVDLKTIMQEDVLLTEGQCYRGCLTRDGEDHYLFEEEAHTSGHRHKRNPKLFDGKFVSLANEAIGEPPKTTIRCLPANTSKTVLNKRADLYKRILGDYTTF